MRMAPNLNDDALESCAASVVPRVKFCCVEPLEVATDVTEVELVREDDVRAIEDDTP